MAQDSHAAQTKCSGLLFWENSDTNICAATCYGVAAPIWDAHVDLVEHHRERAAPHGDAVLHSLSCLGSGIYQHQPDKSTGTIPPPACLGLEFQRYKQAVMLPSSSPAASHVHSNTDPLHPQHAPTVGHDIELLHAERNQHASGPTDGSTSSNANNNANRAHMHHPEASSSSSSSRPVMPTAHGPHPEYHGRPSLVERLQELHAEVSERLEGQDPLWFGKAFMARAALNWDSMKSMAGQVLESAKADLGLQQKSEEPK